MTDRIERTELGQQDFDLHAWYDYNVVQQADDLSRQLDAQTAQEARQEAIGELDEYILGMSIEEAETALQGLKDYAAELVKNRDIVQGWEKYID